MRLVLIETFGIQEHIFSSNRLREMVGASEQIRRLGFCWVKEACNDICTKRILATSGKAMVLVKDCKTANSLVTDVVGHALDVAPGLMVMGAHVEADDMGSALAFHDSVTAVNREMSRLRGLAPPAQAHLARLPFAEDCRSTGHGAADYDLFDPALVKEGVPVPYSAGSLAKRKMREGAIANLVCVLGLKQEDLHKYDAYPNQGLIEVDGLDDFDATWRAVIHADGNGMGEIFVRFGEFAAKAGDNTADDYIKSYNSFSKALDEANSAAVNAATRKTWPEFLRLCDKDPRKVPMKPVVLAGDDLTVICDGARAVFFAQCFVEAFREETAKSCSIRRIMEAAESVVASENSRPPRPFEGITSGAGIAIVKSHHPFHRAYELAEQLAKSAKGLPKRWNLPALDFHVSYDGASDLDDIRKPLQNDTLLFAGPYLTGAGPTEGQPEFCTVDELRGLSKGLMPVPGAAVEAKPAGEAASIPASQLHALRDAVMLGEAVAKAAVGRIRARYHTAFAELRGIDPLFISGLSGNTMRTMLLDAMVLADISASDRPAEQPEDDR